MKIRLRILFALLVFSFSLNGSNENSMIVTEGVDQLLPVVCTNSPQKQPDDEMPPLVSVNPDSLNATKCVESQNSRKAQPRENSVTCKNGNSSDQKKITMIGLLIRWIALLLALS